MLRQPRPSPTLASRRPVMIPPLQDLRLRSISRWLKDQPSPPSGEALRSRASEIDEQMLEAFEEREDSLKDRLMRTGKWGTEDGLRTFQTDRLELWNEVLAEFLPPTSE